MRLGSPSRAESPIPARCTRREGAAWSPQNADLRRRFALCGIIAPCMFDGPIDGESFLAWIVQFLVPNLRPGDMVVMDNLSSHKNKAVRQAIRAAGTKLFFLPPYSPDLNPIEQAFPKLKTPLLKANARTIEQVEKCIATLLTQIHPNECLNYFQEAGYTST
jgi:transposase